MNTRKIEDYNLTNKLLSEKASDTDEIITLFFINLKYQQLKDGVEVFIYTS